MRYLYLFVKAWTPAAGMLALEQVQADLQADHFPTSTLAVLPHRLLKDAVGASGQGARVHLFLN
ncbi:hypothetical protein AUC43_12995 [Hymenobacter sedentarius]|uniref:Uncharacterized protein n=1 Tax=Hymenobacter sedentarius TaxID=1411621 RepID=A0A0U4ACL0_9BACT|nr:hypothetical protein AUC43_12995 [Hymenobacter sedentarius]